VGLFGVRPTPHQNDSTTNDKDSHTTQGTARASKRRRTAGRPPPSSTTNKARRPAPKVDPLIKLFLKGGGLVLFHPNNKTGGGCVQLFCTRDNSPTQAQQLRTYFAGACYSHRVLNIYNRIGRKVWQTAPQGVKWLEHHSPAVLRQHSGQKRTRTYTRTHASTQAHTGRRAGGLHYIAQAGGQDTAPPRSCATFQKQSAN
jgi:hypothetical protein